jgi:hypothetical protein
MKRKTSCRPSALWSIAVLLCFSVVCASLSVAAEKPDANRWKKEKIEKFVTKFFLNIPGFKEGDLITKTQVDSLLKHMSKQGWVVKPAEREAIIDRVLDDNSFMVQQLTTAKGRSFLNRIRNLPNGIDRVERIAEMPKGKRDVQALIYRVPDGHKWIEALTVPKNGVRLNQNFNRSAHGSKMYEETDRLYFAHQLIEELASVVEIPKGSSAR